MGLRDCLTSAAEQGAISKYEAAALADDFEERFAQNRLSMGDDAAKAKARQDMEAALRGQAIEKKRLADLTEAARLRVKERVLQDDPFKAAMGFLSHYGYRDGSSMRGKAEAIMATSHAKVSDVMFSFRRKGMLGKRENPAMVGDLVKELHGEASGDATAKALARSLSTVFEDLRQRFNAAGGAIGKLDNFGLPHTHDRLKVKAMGRAAWKDFIRPLLDPARILDPLSGQPVGARLEGLLDHVYENVVSEGRAHMRPQMRAQGKGAIASQRMDERILHFSDAASWMAYHKKAGRGDVIQTAFQHINGMAKDIAAMETLGANPASMVEYMKQLVSREVGRKEAGLPSLAADGIFKDSQAAWASHRLDALYQTLRGNPSVVSGWASATSNVKNFLTSAQLAATAILAGVTDPFVSAAARRLAGLPVTSTIAGMMKNIASGTRDEIVRSGVMWDEYVHVMGDELRFAGPAVGSEWSRWLADKAVTWSGLKPLTTGRKLLEARAWQGHIADLARPGVSFAKLDPRLKRTLEGFGVTGAHWALWSKAVDPNGFVTPRQLELNGGAVSYLDMAKFQVTDPAFLAEAKALAHREASEKLAELTTSWSERSVPSGTPNARSVVTGVAKRGTIPGEIIDYMLQYKSFALSFTSLQLEAIGEMASAKGGGKGFRSGAAYLAALAVPLTLAGGAYIQIKSLLDGKDPEPMDNAAFWIKSTLTGGGVGLFGDFVKAGENRFGQSFAESLAGPGLNFLGDAFGLVLGNAMQAAQGQAMQLGRETAKFMGRYTPILSSHWATRGAYRRLFLDNLQWLTDPAADKSFKSQAALAKKNGAEFWFPPGSLTPSRAVKPVRKPDLMNAVSR